MPVPAMTGATRSCLLRMMPSGARHLRRQGCHGSAARPMIVRPWNTGGVGSAFTGGLAQRWTGERNSPPPNRLAI